MAPSYIETDSGNKVSRQCSIVGSQSIILGGKTIIQPGVIIRGDLRRSGAGSSGSAVVVAIGKYCVLSEGCIIRPPYKTYKGVFSYYPTKIGDYVNIGPGSIVEAASIGNGVEIGKNCIIGPFVIIKDNSRIADNSVVAAGTIIPSLGLWGGSPAQMVSMLPESTPELTEAKAKAFFTNFNPE